jgi:hypothetical protein
VTDLVFNVPRWDGQAREVSLVWRLTKGAKVAGAEIRVEAAGEFIRSESSQDPIALVEIAMAWKVQFSEKGWV